jgi:hypothetical protein
MYGRNIGMYQRNGDRVDMSGITGKQYDNTVVMHVNGPLPTHTPPRLRALLLENAFERVDVCGDYEPFPKLPDALMYFVMFNCRSCMFGVRLPYALRALCVVGSEPIIPHFPERLQELHIVNNSLQRALPRWLHTLTMLHMREGSHKVNVTDAIRTLNVDITGLELIDRWPAELRELRVYGDDPIPARLLPLPGTLKLLVCGSSVLMHLEDIPDEVNIRGFNETDPSFKDMSYFSRAAFKHVRG